jgi:two-component system, NtrC family, sensor kinase
VKKGLEVCEQYKLSIDPRLYLNAADAYQMLGLYEKAIENYTLCKNILEDQKNLKGVSIVLNNIGNIFSNRRNDREALNYYLKSIKIREKIGVADEDAGMIINAGSSYYSLKDIENAEKYLIRGISIAEKLNQNVHLVFAFSTYSQILLDKKNFSKAKEIILKGLAIAERNGHVSAANDLTLMLIEYYLITGDTKNARMHLVKMEKHFRKTKAENYYFIYEKLAKVEAACGKFKEAFEYHKKFHQEYEKSFNVEHDLKIQQLLAANEIEAANKIAVAEKLKNVELKKTYDELDIAHKELKATQAQLIQQEKMASLGVLTAGVAHEINNPINFVKANVSPLKRNLQEVRLIYEKISAFVPPGLKADVEKLKKEYDLDYTLNETNQLLTGIEEGATRTAQIVNSLGNFTRTDENEKKKTDLQESLESTLMLLHPKVKKKNVSIEKSYSSLPAIECFPGQLNQVFMNIINNAIDAVDEGGVIRLELGSRKELEVRSPKSEDSNISPKPETLNSKLETNDWLVVKISDNGYGMTEEVKAKIFDPFFTTKDVGKGTGLGLSISYGIIEKHGGMIEVESEVGKGSEFRIYLPV